MKKKLLLGMATIAFVANAAVVNPVSKNLDDSKLVVKEWGGKSTRLKAMQATESPATTHRAPAATQSLVYSEDFESTSTTPDGWIIVDASSTVSFPMSCGGLQGLDAYSGTYYLISGYDPSAARDAWAISGGVKLEGGTTYYVGICAYTPGYNNSKDEWKLTVGTAQAQSAQTTVVIDKTGSNAEVTDDWKVYTGTFTPSVSGTYYWGINHCTSVADVNAVAFDLLQVDTEGIKVLPRGSMYSIGGLWSLDGFMTDENGQQYIPTVYLNSNSSLEYGYVAEDCESVEWDFGENAENSTSTVANPVVKYTFPEDSIYNDVILLMKNAAGESYAMRGFNAKNLSSSLEYSDFVGNFKPEDSFSLYSASSSGYDFVFGLQSDFTKMAELYELPEGVKTDLYGFYVIAYYYNMTALNRIKNITVSVYAVDENGLPGETLYSTTARISDVFGTSAFASLGLVPFVFDAPVTTTGSFFIGIEFPAITPSSSNYLALVTTSSRVQADNSMYFYNDVDLEGYPMGWYGASEIYGGLNTSAAIFALIQYQTSGVKTSKIDNNSIVYANGKELNIINAAVGSSVTVTDVAGRTVWAGKVTNGVKSTVETNLSRGIYIVTVDGKSTKVAIR